MTIELRERFSGCLLGLATGDAVGTTVEFKSRGTFPPLTDMVGGGPFRLRPGEWTDDTSMALCLATSLIESRGFDPVDQMTRYANWASAGYLSSTGTCFDIGNTTAAAISRFERDGNPFAGSTHPRSAGNGSIMRLAPVPMFYYPDITKAITFSMESSRTTHGALECLEACALLAQVLVRALSGKQKSEVLFSSSEIPFKSGAIASIAAGDYREKSVDNIRGTGYVVQSLEAALWCFHQTTSFKEAILQAANLGDDADTTAAVCGQIAGAYYGEGDIPQHWLERLVKRSFITSLADELAARARNSAEH